MIRGNNGVHMLEARKVAPFAQVAQGCRRPPQQELDIGHKLVDVDVGDAIEGGQVIDLMPQVLRSAEVADNGV